MQKMNFHTHSEYCDGSGKPEEYVQTALRKNFHALGFSGHTPLPFPNNWTMDEETLPVYLNDIRQLKKRYSGRIEIYLGLETDYLDEKRNAASPNVQALNLDYQIGSIHMLPDPEDGQYFSFDGPLDELHHLIQVTFGGSVRKFITAYYHQMARMLEIGGFDIIGHFDLIKKHNREVGFFSEDESWYRSIVEETIMAVAESGLLLEVNTGAMSRGYTSEPYPSPWILDLCAQAGSAEANSQNDLAEASGRSSRGGIPVVISADAHKPDLMDYAFEEIEEMLLAAGYRHSWGLLQNRWQEVWFD